MSALDVLRDKNVQICMVLGIDYMKVKADSMTLEIWGNNVAVRWEGFAVMDSSALAGLLADGR
jgi:hypothetical protein